MNKADRKLLKQFQRQILRKCGEYYGKMILKSDSDEETLTAIKICTKQMDMTIEQAAMYYITHCFPVKININLSVYGDFSNADEIVKAVSNIIPPIASVEDLVVHGFSFDSIFPAANGYVAVREHEEHEHLDPGELASEHRHDHEEQEPEQDLNDNPTFLSFVEKLYGEYEENEEKEA